MTGNAYRDLIAEYLLANFGDHDLVVYTEVSLGKTIIGKDRRVDVFAVHRPSRQALAIECKFQGSQGTVDEKIPYALGDLEAMRVPGCLAYAGEGWSRGILHTLEASPLAAYCLPTKDVVDGGRQGSATSNSHEFGRGEHTRELDHVVAATFGLWETIIPERRRFTP